MVISGVGADEKPPTAYGTQGANGEPLRSSKELCGLARTNGHVRSEVKLQQLEHMRHPCRYPYGNTPILTTKNR
jgi:hypothetical protein